MRKIFAKIKRYRENEKNITINELRQLQKANVDFILLDVRSKQEYDEGHLNRGN